MWILNKPGLPSWLKCTNPLSWRLQALRHFFACSWIFEISFLLNLELHTFSKELVVLWSVVSSWRCFSRFDISIRISELCHEDIIRLFLRVIYFLFSWNQVELLFESINFANLLVFIIIIVEKPLEVLVLIILFLKRQSGSECWVH